MEESVYQFVGFVFDIPRGILLTAEGELIQLQYKSLELLRLFVENAGRLLDRDTINQAVWSSAAVSYDNITQCVRNIRWTPGDDVQTIIKTVPRRIYVSAAKVTGGREERAAQPIGNAATLLDKPSIAVLAFTNMSGDPNLEYFVDGMVEEIITALSRIRWLFVIDRNSSFDYKGQAVEMKRVGRELGVRYVLEGWVRKAGQQMRITGLPANEIPGVIGRDIRFAADDRQAVDRYAGSNRFVPRLRYGAAITVGAITEDVNNLAISRITTRRQHLSGNIDGSADRGKSRNGARRLQQHLGESVGGGHPIGKRPRRRLIMSPRA
jgi:TolB-like protein